MYSSPYLAEFYDIYWSEYFATAKDVSIYRDQLDKARPTSSAGRLTVLDVATGTGRVLFHLTKTQDPDKENVYIGTDLSADMINRAKAQTPSDGPQPIWVIGSALELEQSIKSVVAPGTVDLIVVAFGTISHFGESASLSSFLTQVKSLLRANTGRAAISIGTDLLDVSEDKVTIPGEKETKFMPSKEFPGIHYKETLVDSKVIDGRLIDRREVLIVRETDTGERAEVGRELAVSEFSIFQTGTLLRALDAAGLKRIDVEQTEVEQIWILGHDHGSH